MRTQLFRTPATLVGGAGVTVATKDVDGVAPLTLFVENMDQYASLVTRFGSKNANVRFVAAVAGTAGNNISVEIDAAPNQAFSIDVTAYAILIHLQCDADGRPNQFVSDIVELLNADAEVAALVRVSLALASDGSAAMELLEADQTHAMDETDLAGGAAAVTTGAVTVEVSPSGAPDFPGPWTLDSAGGTALSTVAANTAKSYTITAPLRGVRIKVSQGVGPTRVVASGQATKKGL